MYAFFKSVSTYAVSYFELRSLRQGCGHNGASAAAESCLPRPLFGGLVRSLHLVQVSEVEDVQLIYCVCTCVRVYIGGASCLSVVSADLRAV